MKFQAGKEDKIRLDKFLNKKLIHHSRHFIQKLIKNGKVFVDEKIKSSGYVIKPDDVVEIDLSPEKPIEKKGNIEINYEDEDIIVIEKPSNIVVYSEKIKEDSVIKILKSRIKIKEKDERSGVIHRLDRDTTGILVIAKNLKSQEFLKKQFQERKVEKRYKALVFGHLIPQKGEINIPLERSAKERLKRTVGEKGKSALTKYEVLEYISYKGADYSLLDILLTTGRTHQIRVHMEAIGHPLAGDKHYTNKKYLKINEKENFDRQFLHSYFLGFLHPKSNKWMEFTSEIPQDLKEILNKIKS